MLIGIVEGNAISTIKHRSILGWKLLIVQPLDFDDAPDGDPVLALDMLGAGAFVVLGRLDVPGAGDSVVVRRACGRSGRGDGRPVRLPGRLGGCAPVGDGGNAGRPRRRARAGRPGPQ